MWLMMVSHASNEKKIHSVVVGAGPAGISAALSLLMKGHDVTLIDKRRDDARKQKVIIPRDLIERFSQIDLADQTYLQKLRRMNGATSLKSFQRFQMSMLKRIYEGKKITFEGNVIEIKGKLKTLFDNDNEVTEVNGDEQTLTLKKKNIIAFDNIIDATGNKRAITSLLSKNSKGRYSIQYKKDLPQPIHKSNAIICFSYPIYTNIRVASFMGATNYSLSVFQRLGWNKDYIPIYYLYTSAGKKYIYALLEIPDTLLGEQDHNKLIDFVKPILTQECKIPARFINVKNENIKLLSTFKTKHKIADTPYVTLKKGGAAIVVGDALMPANFHFGHGVKKGIDDGLALFHAFDANNQLNGDILKHRSKTIRREVMEYIKEHNKIIRLKNFRYGIWNKFKFFFNELFDAENVNFAFKALLIGGVFAALYMPLGCLVGISAFAYMKYIHFYASFTYKIPRYVREEYEQAYQAGELAQRSWKGYCTSFFHIRNYKNYYNFMEGSYQEKKRARLARP